MNDTKLLKSKGLEQKLYLTYHKDGLLDLTIGIGGTLTVITIDVSITIIVDRIRTDL